MIAWWGRNIQGGRKISDLVSFTDIAPTFLEVAGVDIPAEMSGNSFLNLLTSERSGQIELKRTKVYTYRERHGFYPNSHGHTTPARAVRTDEYLLIWNINTDSTHRDVDGGPAKSYMDENKDQFPELYDLTFGRRPEFELYNIKSDPFQMKNLAENTEHAERLEILKSDLFAYLKERGDPRMFDNGDVFHYNPYFGVAFQEGLLKWTPEQQGQDLSFEERRELLQKAYSMNGEEEFFEEMIKRQKGKL